MVRCADDGRYECRETGATQRPVCRCMEACLAVWYTYTQRQAQQVLNLLFLASPSRLTANAMSVLVWRDSSHGWQGTVARCHPHLTRELHKNG